MGDDETTESLPTPLDSDLTAPLPAPRPTAVDRHPAPIGPYRIERVLGEGGMGVVYLAEQTKPIHRRVALKLIKLGMDTKQVIARFEAEREALAMMNHPNVAKVHDAGATEQGRPYFVMEYVEGVPLTNYCDRNRLSTKERLKLFMQVCHAVQHAHQKGIIHRDLKPSNVLVTKVDNAPAVKVIDFGIAKATQQRLAEATLFTEQGQLVGTPAYMSPEQADPTTQDIDTRTDVYSLGVILYELLVGALPFDPKTLRQAALIEIQRLIREVDPPKPSSRLSAFQSEPRAPATGLSEPRPSGSGPKIPREVQPPLPHGRGSEIEHIAHQRRTEPKTLIREIRGDLDWIVMKCLEKDRARRYDSPNGIALELERYLNHEPVLAGPPSATYRMGKFVRRNRLAVTAAAVVILTLTAGLVGTTAMYLRASAKEAEARRISEFMSDILKGAGPAVALGRDTTMLKEMLDAAAERIRKGELQGIPEAELRLRGTLGDTYFELADFSATLSLIEPALALARELYGPDSAESARAQSAMAHLHYSGGRYDESERVFREVLATRQTLYGEAHPDVATSLVDVAMVVDRKGNHTAAQQLYQQALAMQRRLLGEDHQAVGYTAYALATTLENLGDYAGAVSMLRESLRVLSDALGQNHPRVVVNMIRLGRALSLKGNFNEATTLLAESLVLSRKLFGDRHVRVGDALHAVALTQDLMGSYDEAIPLFREAVAVYEGSLGSDNVHAAQCQLRLAFLLGKKGEFDEAERLNRKALATFREQLGELHPHVAIVLENLAMNYRRVGDWGKAEVAARESLNLIRKTLGHEHPGVIATLHSLGSILVMRDDCTAAAECFSEARDLALKKLGEQHFGSAACFSGLASVGACLGDWVGAEQNCRKSLAIHEKIQGENHIETVDDRVNLAWVLSQKGANDEAEQLAQTCLTALESNGAQTRLSRYDAMTALGTVFAARGRFVEARDALVDSHAALHGRVDVPQYAKRELLRRIVKLYESWDAAEPGKGYAEKAAEWRAKLDELQGAQARSDDATKVNAETPNP